VRSLGAEGGRLSGGGEALELTRVKVEPPVTVNVKAFPETGTSAILCMSMEASVR
jgi:hypothetical protein